MGDRLMVFAPAPVLTVTVEQQGEAVELHVHPGGQGVWQARMAASLGCDVVLCVSAGGEVGGLLTKLLVDEDVELRVVERGASSGWYVHDRRDGQRDSIADDPGAPLVRHDLDEIYDLALVEGLRADVSLLSGPADPGVVPADAYRRLAADLTANGGTVVADLSGDHLEAVLDAGVAFVKVSHEELIDAGRAEDESTEALVAAGRQLLEDGAEAAVVSRAGEPALAFLDGAVHEVVAPPLQVTDHRGAGDSMTAGIATVLARGGTLTDAVRMGAAAGALNVTRHGLGTGHVEAVRALLDRVELRPAS